MLSATMLESDRCGPPTVRAILELLGAAFALHPAETEVLELGADARPAFPSTCLASAGSAARCMRTGFTAMASCWPPPLPAWSQITFNTEPDRSSWIQIILNGTPCQTHAATLAGALATAGVTGRIATALNGYFGPAALRDRTPIRDGDRIEGLTPRRGG